MTRLLALTIAFVLLGAAPAFADLTITASHAPGATLHTPCCAFLKAPQTNNDTKYPSNLTLTVKNSGDTATSGTVTVVDALPAGLSGNINMVAFGAGPVAASGSGWSCSGTNTLTCTRADSLAAGASYPPITITAITAPTAAATLTNAPTVAIGSQTGSTTDTISVVGDDCPNGWTPEQEITISPAWGAGLHGGIHTGVINPTKPDGCTFLDELWALEPYSSHAVFMARAQELTSAYVAAGLLTALQKSTIDDAAANSDVGTAADHTVDNSCDRRVAITFDDGPSRYRADTLATGRDKQVHFVFQDLSIRAAANPQFESFSQREGHVVLSHTVVHPMLPNLSDSDIRDEVLTAQAMFDNIGTPLTFLGIRQPSSDATGHTSDIMTQLGYAYVTSPPRVNVNDYEPTREPATTVAGLLAGVHPGVIFGMHDGAWDTRNGPNTVAATRMLIDQLRTMGYCFGVYDHTAQVVADRYVAGPDPLPQVQNPVPYKYVAAGAGFQSPDPPPSPFVYYVPPLAISATHTPATFTQGQTGTLTLTASNISGDTGPTTLANNSSLITVRDAVPAGLTVSGPSGNGWTCTGTTTVSCTRSDALAPHSSFPPITIPVTVTGAAAASLLNQPTANGHGGSWNPEVDDTIPVASKPAWVVTQAAANPLRQGDPQDEIIVHVQQTTQSASTDGTPITAVITAPAASAGVVPLTITSVSGTGWTCAGTTCTRSDVRSGANELPPLHEVVAVYNPVVTPCTGTCPTASGNQTVSVSGGGSVNAAVTSTMSYPIAGAADLTVASAHTGNFVQGDAGAYTLTVTNASGGATTAGATVAVTDTLPVGLTATRISGAGWTCSLTTVSCTRSGDAPVAVGGSYPPITLAVAVDNDAGGSLTNRVTVAGGGELNSANDSGTDATTVTGAPDLAVSALQSGPLRQGDDGNAGDALTLTVRNDGAGATNGTATLIDELPAGLNPVSMSGSGWTCTVATVSCTSTAAVAAGASYPTVTLTVAVAPNAPSAAGMNQIHVSGAGERNTTNDSVDQQIAVTQIPDVTVVIAHSGSFIQGGTGTYALLVSNVSASPALGPITVRDALPAGLTATTLSGDGWTCTPATLTCTREDPLGVPQAGGPTLPVLSGPWNYPPINVAVKVARNAAATVTNVATATGGGQIFTDDDIGSDPTPIAQVAVTSCPAITVATVAGTPLPVQFGCTGDGLTYTVATAPAHGTLGPIAGDRVTYTPAAGFAGDDQFTISATNRIGEVQPLAVHVIVVPRPAGAQATDTTPGLPLAQLAPVTRAPARRVPQITRSVSVKGRTVTVRGKVLAPAGVTCAGTVQVTLRAGSARVTRRIVLARDCSFRVALRVGGRSRAGTVTLRFAGNAALLPRSGTAAKARLR